MTPNSEVSVVYIVNSNLIRTMTLSQKKKIEGPHSCSGHSPRAVFDATAKDRKETTFVQVLGPLQKVLVVPLVSGLRAASRVVGCFSYCCCEETP